MESFLWIGFILLVLLLMAVDLGLHRRRPHVLFEREGDLENLEDDGRKRERLRNHGPHR